MLILPHGEYFIHTNECVHGGIERLTDCLAHNKGSFNGSLITVVLFRQPLVKMEETL